MKTRSTCLTIAGFDPSGGAGIIADLRAFQAFECDSAAVVTSVTFQNGSGFFGAEHQSAESVARQLDAVLAEHDIVAIKTGMLPTAAIVDAIAKRLEGWNGHMVIDPVIGSSSGRELIGDEALALIVKKLFPRAALITPNMTEAERLTGHIISSDQDAGSAARFLLEGGAHAVLIKGGHASGKMAKGRDLLFTDNGREVFDEKPINVEMRGTGCTLASAIAANLAIGLELSEAIRTSKKFLTDLLKAKAAEA